MAELTTAINILLRNCSRADLNDKGELFLVVPKQKLMEAIKLETEQIKDAYETGYNEGCAFMHNGKRDEYDNAEDYYNYKYPNKNHLIKT